MEDQHGQDEHKTDNRQQLDNSYGNATQFLNILAWIQKKTQLKCFNAIIQFLLYIVVFFYNLNLQRKFSIPLNEHKHRSLKQINIWQPEQKTFLP